MKRFLLISLLGSLILSACGPGQLLGPSFTPTATMTQTSTNTPTYTPTYTSTYTPTITQTPTPTLTPTPAYTVISAENAINIKSVFPSIDLDQHLSPNFIEYHMFDFIDWAGKPTLAIIGYLVFPANEQYQVCFIPEDGSSDCQVSKNGVFWSGNTFYTGQLNKNQVTIWKGINETNGDELASFYVPADFYMLELMGIDPKNQIFFYDDSTSPNTSVAYLWNYRTSRPVFRWPKDNNHEAYFDSLEFSPDGQYSFMILDLNGSKELVIFDLVNGVAKQINHYSWIAWSGSINFSPDGQEFCFFPGDLTCMTYKPPFKVVYYHPTFLDGWGISSAFSPDGSLIAVGSNHGSVDIIRTSDGKVITNFDTTGGGIIGIAFSPDGKYLATGSENFHIEFWGVQK